MTSRSTKYIVSNKNKTKKNNTIKPIFTDNTFDIINNRGL